MAVKMIGCIALEDGRIFSGTGFGAEGVQTGELVFNTSMTGYQEILTDPSYHKQIVTMTVSHVGNTGVNLADPESARVWVAGFVVRALSPVVSNWREQGDLDSYLKSHGVIGLSDVATRALVRHIRSVGVMRAAIAHGEAASDPQALVEIARQSPDMSGWNLVDDVTAAEPYNWDERSDPRWYRDHHYDSSGPLIVAYDFGIKRNILRRLVHIGAQVTVVPALTSAEDVLALQPDGVFLSNGPGDPEPLQHQAAQVRKLIGRTPVFGICLGHQILGLALGGKTFKLKFGHRGANHPVLNRRTNKVEITSQNHGFAVDPDSLPDSTVELTHINLNDHTLEGLRHKSEPVFCVQYHPEAAPGPHDSHYLFDEFAAMMAEFQKKP